MSVTSSQFIGSLLGQALGDALGFVVEGYPPNVCYEYVEGLRAGKAGAYGRGQYPFGQYTDDTQLARELLHSLTLRQRFVPEDYAHRIAHIFQSNRIVGGGRATAEAAARLAQGVAWHQAGALPPSAGNGSAMRAGPVGLMYYDDPEQLITVACEQARITHQDPRCQAGSVAIAGAVSLALLSGGTTESTIDPVEFCQTLSGWASPIHADFGASLLKLPNWLQHPPEEVMESIAREGLEPGYMDFWQGISPFVTGSVLWSIYSFLRSPDDYFAAICLAIQPGGDVDTTAAMTGAISGARLAYERLPQPLVRRLTDQGTWDFDSLKALAWQTFALKHP